MNVHVERAMGGIVPSMRVVGHPTSFSATPRPYHTHLTPVSRWSVLVLHSHHHPFPHHETDVWGGRMPSREECQGRFATLPHILCLGANGIDHVEATATMPPERPAFSPSSHASCSIPTDRVSSRPRGTRSGGEDRRRCSQGREWAEGLH